MLKSWNANYAMVFWIAKAMGYAKPSNELAHRIAARFTFRQLDRIYKAVHGRRNPAVLAELIGREQDTTLRIAA